MRLITIERKLEGFVRLLARGRRAPAWLWFAALWCAGVAAAGFAAYACKAFVHVTSVLLK